MVNKNFDYEIESNLVSKNKTEKTQIILMNTQYPIQDYLVGLKLRYNKKYNKVPAYTIDRSGTLYVHYDAEKHVNFFENDELNQSSIAISLENVGWLDYIENKGVYVDWRGLEYTGAVVNKIWRNKKHWADYTIEQFDVLLNLIDYLCIEHSINKRFIGNNVLFDGAMEFKGILNRSNFNKSYTDLTPAFNFEKLTKKINQNGNN